MKVYLSGLCIIVAIYMLATNRLNNTNPRSTFVKQQPLIKQAMERNTFNTSTTFATGDVFAGVGNGKVNWYHPDGAFVSTLDTGMPGQFTTGMAFDSVGNLYVTTFNGGNVKRFDKSGNLLGTFGDNYSGSPESIVFDGAGNVYVGSVDGDSDIRKFDANGKLITRFNVAVDDRGADWIDLSSDQCTMFYSSESKVIKRFNVCTNTQLPDFTTILHGRAYALRILPDGSVLVADSVDIHLINTAGQIVKTYDAPGEDQWFALNLDPDGTSFWSGNIPTGNLYRFDIASGNIRLGPISTCGQNCLFGLTVYKENVISSIKFRLPFDLLSSTSKIDGTDRINSYFDHEYPLERPDLGGSEPQTKGINDTIMIYTGVEYPDAWIYREDASGKWYSGHDGYDFRGTEGKTAVYAAHDGTAAGITLACTKTISINAVRVTQGRYQTLYLHVYDDNFYQDLVKHPRDVKAGERIGTVGNSGSPVCSKGAHLHFATYYDANGDGAFDRNEKIDPYGFNSTQKDPWTATPYNGPQSSWIWEFNRTAETTLIPGNAFALASGNMRIEVPANAVTSQAFVSLMTVPDPNLKVSRTIEQRRLTTTSASLAVGSNFQLTGIYADGAPVTVFATPITLRFGYSNLDLSNINLGTLAVYQWDETSNRWLNLPTTIDTTAGQAVAASSKVGLFSLLAQPLNAAPQLISISPSSIDNNLPTTISIQGANFMATPWVEVGTTALDITYISPSQLTANVSSGIAPGVYTVIVRNPDGQTVALPDALIVKNTNLVYGDCNGDHIVGASDITALAQEFFDGDDNNNPAATSGGSYPGNPGCDANQDSHIGASDVTCIGQIFFKGPGACQADVSAATSATPVLSIPHQLAATSGGKVTVPIILQTNGSAVNSLLFAVNYDEKALNFDSADNNHDGIPDAITFTLPQPFLNSVTFDKEGANGELRFVVTGFSAPPTALKDGPLLSVTFDVAQLPTATESAVQIAQPPAASFADTQGRALVGTTVSGSVLIADRPAPTASATMLYLPLIVTNH